MDRGMSFVPAATIRYWMERRGYNQTTLAAKVGVSQVAVSHWLAYGDHLGPDLKFATGVALAAALGIAPADLLRMPPSNGEGKAA